MAYTSGLSAWWFTLGGGLGCLVMAVVFVRPLYARGVSTLPEVFALEYGQSAATAAALLMSIGNFLTIAAQIISGVALITAVSRFAALPAALITTALMFVYVVFGGLWGAGMVGMCKTVLLYAGVGACGLIALSLQGGVSGFSGALEHERYFNMFSRGISTDLSSMLSVVLGVLTTQTYFQAAMSARSLKLSRAGVLSCAALTPIIGIAGIYVGMYMKLRHPDIASATALPLFVLENLPAPLAGAILAMLLVAIVGTGAGISLGLSSMLASDIYKVYIGRQADSVKLLKVNRAVITAVLACALLFTLANDKTAILSLSFLSMGLRGSVGFLPLCAALFLPNKIPPRFVMVSMIVSPICVVIGRIVMPPDVDSLFFGIGCSLVIMLAGVVAKDRFLG
jgi:SSS family solute:Na+ symporter